MNNTLQIMIQNTLWCNSWDPDFNQWSSGALNVWSVEWYYTLVEHFNSTGGTRKWQGRLRAASQQYHREYKKDSDDWFLSQQWQATACLHYTSKISEVGGNSSTLFLFSVFFFYSLLEDGMFLTAVSKSDSFETHVWADVSAVSDSFLSKHAVSGVSHAGSPGVHFSTMLTFLSSASNLFCTPAT